MAGQHTLVLRRTPRIQRSWSSGTAGTAGRTSARTSRSRNRESHSSWHSFTTATSAASHFCALHQHWLGVLIMIREPWLLQLWHVDLLCSVAGYWQGHCVCCFRLLEQGGNFLKSDTIGAEAGIQKERVPQAVLLHRLHTPHLTSPKPETSSIRSRRARTCCPQLPARCGCQCR